MAWAVWGLNKTSLGGRGVDQGVWNCLFPPDYAHEVLASWSVHQAHNPKFLASLQPLAGFVPQSSLVQLLDLTCKSSQQVFSYYSGILILYYSTVEPRYNDYEVPRDWQNLFSITRFCYIKVLSHIMYFPITVCKQNPSLYWGLCHIEVCCIKVPLYMPLECIYIYFFFQFF